MAFALAAGPALAEKELVVEASPCAKTVRIHARDVPTDEIVRSLTGAMGAKLVARTSLPQPVSFDGKGAPEELLKRLLRDQNLVMETGRKAACGSREVLSTVWLLPAGEAAPARGAAATAPLVQGSGEVQFAPVEQRPLPPKFGRRMGHPMNSQERQRVTREWREGKLDLDPATGKLVPAQPAPDAAPPEPAKK